MLATFDDAGQARKAIEALGRAGIEADEMSVGGRSLKQAGTDADTRGRDVKATNDLASKAGAGAALGLVVGLVVAGVAVLVAGLGPDSPGFWIALVGAAIAGAAVGGMLGGVRKLPLTQEWELTYNEDASESDGSFRVAVRAADEKDMERAREVLESEGARNVGRLRS